MKRILLILLLSLPMFASAQIKYKGQWAADINAGITIPKGLTASLNVERYFGKGSVRAGFDFIQNDKHIVIDDFKIKTYGFNLNYFYTLNSKGKRIFFNIGGGGFIGLETIQKKDLPEGMVLDMDNRLVYGIAGIMEAEFLITRQFSILAKPGVKYIFNSNHNDFFFNPQIGFKVYF